MRIGLVTGEFPPMQGGVGAFTQELAKALTAAGHEVHIITAQEARPPEAPRPFWNWREPIPRQYGFLHPRVRRWWWGATAVVAEIAGRYDLDVVNLQYQAAAYDMYLPAINFLSWRLHGLSKAVVTFHDLRVPYLFPKAGRLRPWVVRYLARSSDGVIATNRADFQELLALEMTRPQLDNIPIGSNIEARLGSGQAGTIVRRRLGLADDQPLLGYFGFLNETKGADTLLQALSRLDRAFHLVFIGGRTGSSDAGNNQAFLMQMEQLAEQLELTDRVHWTDFLPDEDVSAFLMAVDLMAMPYRDGVSLRRGTLMAALAHGRPLVTTSANEPVPELIHGQNVWLVPAGDPDKLAEAIQMVTADRALLDRLAQGAAEVAALFAWDRIASRTAAFYQRVIEGRPSKP